SVRPSGAGGGRREGEARSSMSDVVQAPNAQVKGKADPSPLSARTAKEAPPTPAGPSPLKAAAAATPVPSPVPIATPVEASEASASSDAKENSEVGTSASKASNTRKRARQPGEKCRDERQAKIRNLAGVEVCSRSNQRHPASDCDQSSLEGAPCDDEAGQPLRPTPAATSRRQSAGPALSGTPEIQIFSSGVLGQGEIYRRTAWWQKRVWLIRHAESMANADEDRCGQDICDPLLTEHGHQQALSLRKNLTETLRNVDPSDVLWVISPLRRAVETFMRACPWQTALEDNSLHVVVKSLVREKRCGNNGVGSSEAELRSDYPALSSALQDLGECWWGTTLQEPKEEFEERVRTFRLWLRKQTLPVVVVVSHCGFIRQLTGFEANLKNAESVEVYI
ncbi:unnamed protein product, partial [Ostreobium quekettii]